MSEARQPHPGSSGGEGRATPEPTGDERRAQPDSLGRSARGDAGGAAQPPPHKRALYLDAFRGLMALVMVQGHVMDTLLAPDALAHPLYGWQLMLHGSTAPGFLFASGFVVGLPRAPLSLRAGLRRARRLLFVLAVGYWLHLPYLSLWKTLGAATSAEWAALLACDALQLIAATQLFVLVLQATLRQRWTPAAGGLALAIAAATPLAWSSGLSARLPEALAPWLDAATGSHFPVFPFSAFVLAGALAGTLLGHLPRPRRRRSEVVAGAALLIVGVVLARLLAGRVDFWGPSPAYVFVRLGGLLLLLWLVDAVAASGHAVVRALALLGHETLLVYVLHLMLLFGGVFGPAPLVAWHGSLGFAGASLVLLLMIPVLLAAAWLWRSVKQRAPREAELGVWFVTIAFLWEFALRPW